MEQDYKLRLTLTIERIKKCGKYNLVPACSMEDIKIFESKFDVQIPESYKWFVTTIANGVVSKHEWGFNLLDSHDWANYWFLEDEYNPSIPFPLTTRMVYSNKESSDRDDKFPYETIYDDEGDFFHNGYRFGEISLVGTGCGSDYFLVVKGNEYGNVWVDNFSSNEEVYPVFDDKLNKKRLKFTDWLEFMVELACLK